VPILLARTSAEAPHHSRHRATPPPGSLAIPPAPYPRKSANTSSASLPATGNAPVTCAARPATAARKARSPGSICSVGTVFTATACGSRGRAQTNRLRALLLGGDDTDRELARGALTDTRLGALARRRAPREATREQAIRHAEIRRLALALRDAARALKDNRAQLHTIVNDLVPGLTERRGIGPVSAAQAIVSFSHPGRCRNDAAFAALGGASPLEASSGRTMRHRLNRGGDRALNRALHTIAATRMRSCPTTRAYVARRTAEGKNPKEIRRCLKRYIARQLYRTLSTAMTPPAQISIS
jgi:transposase